MELFDFVVVDVDRYLQSRRLDRLVSQQLASADSVWTNIEEGYVRQSSKEYRRFLIFARASLREMRGRYRRLRHWVPVVTVKERMTLAEGINRMLSAAIASLDRRVR